MVGRNPLNGEGDDLLALALGVALGRFANLANPIGGVGLGLLLHAPNQLVLGILGGHAGHLFQTAAFVADQLVELDLAGGHRVFAVAAVARALAQVPVALLEQLVLAVEDGFALRKAALLALDLFAPAANLGLEVLAELDQLLIAGHD